MLCQDCSVRSRDNALFETYLCSLSHSGFYAADTPDPVSYTHLDVYKRQVLTEHESLQVIPVRTISEALEHAMKR